MISFHQHQGLLVLEYQASRTNNAAWVDEKFERGETVFIGNRVFNFLDDDLIKSERLGYPDGEQSRYFKLGVLKGDYYLIRKDILNLKHDLKISDKLDIGESTFIAYELGSIFSTIDKYTDEPIIVGGNEENAIPLEDFESMLKSFPTKTEVHHYVGARIQRLLGDYFGTMQDSEFKLKKHLERKKKLKTKPKPNLIAEYEVVKFEFYLNQLKDMLECAESYAEKNWQNKIIEIILAIYPKYISVLENVRIKDSYSKENETTWRYIDLALVDTVGNIDVIEIKRPFENKLLAKGLYRDNYVPHRELSGATMQAEKYLFHLNKWGVTGENSITNTYQNQLPENIKIKITNPKSIIILGRSADFEDKQSFDFEIIKRKYSNIIDIITYDDLLTRLENIVKQLSKKVN